MPFRSTAGRDRQLAEQRPDQGISLSVRVSPEDVVFSRIRAQ